MRNRCVRLILAALVATTVLAACGGSKDNRAATTKKVTTTTAGDDATVDTAAGTPSGSQSTTANNLKNSGQPGTTQKAGTPSANSGTSPPASASGLKPTDPGKYKMAITGTRNGQAVNETVDLTVDAPTGADQHSTTQTAQGSQEETLRYLPDGIYLVDLNIAGVIKFHPDPPVLQYPEPATVGKAWEWTIKSTDGGTTVNTKLKILRTENQTVGGETVATTVIDAVVTTSGSFVATSHSTIWVSEKYRQIVRTDDTTDVKQPVFAAGHSETSSKLLSTKPS